MSVEDSAGETGDQIPTLVTIKRVTCVMSYSIV